MEAQLLGHPHIRVLMKPRSPLTACAGLLLVFGASAHAADVCSPKDTFGPYGFQLAGTTTISGPEIPIAVVGRVVLDGAGKISGGYSSVNFNGLFLGNPVTGTYDIKTDCSVTLSLQDTSGAFQQFSGKMQPGGERIDFSQSDPGTSARGVMERTRDDCDATSFRGRYNFAIKALNAVADADGGGGLNLARDAQKTNGTYSVDSDCFVQLDLAIPDTATNLVKLRGILVKDGAELLAIQTDPEQVAAASFKRTPDR
jgi:hypothetical protein